MFKISKCPAIRRYVTSMAVIISFGVFVSLELLLDLLESDFCEVFFVVWLNFGTGCTHDHIRSD